MKFLRNVLATITGLFLFCVLLFLIMGALMKQDEVVLDKPHVLRLNLSTAINDMTNADPLSNFDPVSMKINKTITTYDVLNNIEKAKDDDKIMGILLNLSSIGASMATLEEIRNALIEFKTSGKFIHAYSATMSQKAYYLATVADKIALNPEGMLEFYGLSSSVNFYTKALENLGVKVQVIRHGKFKSAVEPFMLTEMSEASRQQTSTFLGSFWDHMLANIAKERGLTKERLNEIADQMLATAARDAYEVKMVDELAYFDEVEAGIRTILELERDAEIPYVSLGKYNLVKTSKKIDAKNRIAVIYAEGFIGTGMIPGEGGGIQANALVKEIRKARENNRIKAIVLRVNSPGGGALASDIIWRELQLCKGVKPLIASMGGVAASGGYYIACNADTIVASPNTITGSIGVFGLVPNLQNLVEGKIGITTTTVKTNRMADFGDLTRPLSDAERDFLQLNIERTYDTFISRVAVGRGMKKEEVDAIGQGRVWSGVTAKEIGLVDVLGGLEDAIAIAAEKAGLSSFSVKGYPEPKDPLEELLKGANDQVAASIMEEALGEEYQYVKTIREAMTVRGIQARLPYHIDIR